MCEVPVSDTDATTELSLTENAAAGGMSLGVEGRLNGALEDG